MPVTFLKKTWKNGKDTPAPVVGVDPEMQASEFNRLEQGISDAATLVNTVETGLFPISSFGNFRRPLQQPRTQVFSWGVGDGCAAGGTGGTWSADSTDYVTNSSSRKLVTAGNNLVTSLTKTNISPTIDLSNKRILVTLKSDIWTPFSSGASIAFYFSSDNLNTQFFTITAGKFLAATGGIPLPGEDITLSFSPSDWTQGSTVMNAINAIKCQVQDGNQVMNIHIGAVWTEPMATEGVVCFTYDDGLFSTFHDARAYHDKYGNQCTVFPICDQIDVAGGFMTTQMLQNLHNVSGWEVGVHAYNLAVHDQGYDIVGPTVAEDQFRKSLDWLRTRGIWRGPEILAWPLGRYDASTLAVARKYFRAARTTNAGSGNNFESRYPLQYHRLKCRSVIGTDLVSTINGYIDQAMTNKELLILLFHDIGHANQMTVANHNLVVDHAAQVGAKVRTIGDALTMA